MAVVALAPCTHSALPTPPARPPHARKDALRAVLNSPNPAVLDFERKKINASAHDFCGVVPALAAHLGLGVVPFLMSHTNPGLSGSP